MGIVNFSRGELSPLMRYRSDSSIYHKGVETLRNFLPSSQGGLDRRYGTQVLEILPSSDTPPAVRLFTLGATGLDNDISAPGESAAVDIGDATYDTEGRVHDIPKHTEIQILLAFVEVGGKDQIIAFWADTPNRVPAYIQKVWNYDSGYQYPEIDFNDTRNVRVVQIEKDVFVVAKTQIYRLYWDKNKPYDSNLDWDSSAAYVVGDVVRKTVGLEMFFFECVEAHTSTSTNAPDGTSGSTYWQVVYPPYLSWKIVSPRVGHELLSGAGITGDPYEWNANKAYAVNTDYKKGDAIKITATEKWYECQQAYTSGGTITSNPVTDSGEADGVIWTELTDINSLSDEEKIYMRSSYAFREETVPREIAAHHNRLIFAGSSARPSTIFGSQVSHYMDFGAGTNDDDPLIVKLSGDRIGRILWLLITDQLYIGTSGGVFAVSGVITPNQFQLRRVTSHATSDVKAVAAAGSVIFFHKDAKTLREIAYADQAQNYESNDLNIYSDHLFVQYKAVKMVVVNDPVIVIWILRADGSLVSLTYERTVDMFAFARHDFHGMIYDICPGTGDDLFAILETTSGVRQVIRLGKNEIIDTDVDDYRSPQYQLSNTCFDGLMSFVNIDESNQFAVEVTNDSFRTWMEANDITSLSAMLNWTLAVTAASQSLTGTITSCELQYLDEASSIDLSGNDLTGEVPEAMDNTMVNSAVDVSLNLSGNPITQWNMTTIPGTWTTINLSNTSLPIAHIAKFLGQLRASVTATPRTGAIDLTGLVGAIDYENGLEDAIWLLGQGWAVTLDNTAGWDSSVVIFNGNGNTDGVVPSSISCAYGQTVTIPALGADPIVKTGYEFVGWGKSASQGSADYTSGNDYTKNIQDSVTLYAIWIPNSGVSYNGNGNTTGSPPSDPNLYNPGETVTVLSKPSTMLREGYTFTAWNTQSDGLGASFLPGHTFAMGSEPVVLYAAWTVNSYRLSFSSNGATIGSVPSSITQDYKTTVSVPVPTNMQKKNSSNYWSTFSHWNTKADGSGRSYYEGSSFVFPSADITLYAQYRDYALGDTGPSGGVVSYDSGAYAIRATTPGADDYRWRYVEINKDHQSTANRDECNLADGTYRSFRIGPYATIDGVYWESVRSSYLSKIIKDKGTSGIILDYTEYWASNSEPYTKWLIFTKYNHYYVDSYGTIHKTNNENLYKGFLPGRYF